jgi:uncharacterized lipoprotein YajG
MNMPVFVTVLGVCALLAGCQTSAPTASSGSTATVPSSAPSSGTLCLEDAAGNVVEAGLSALEAGNQTAAAVAKSTISVTVKDAVTDPNCAKAVAGALLQ